MLERDRNHPNYGEVIYDAGGLLICHICGKGGLQHLGSHAVKQHRDIISSMREYKFMFGLDYNKGLIIPSLKEKMREKCLENGTINNINDNTQFRFKKGHIGHPNTMVSEQTRRKQISTIQQVNKEEKEDLGRLRGMRRLTIINHFHNTIINIIPKEENGLLVISKDRARKTRKYLCGVKGCSCSGVLGNNGKQQEEFLVEEQENGEVFILN